LGDAKIYSNRHTIHFYYNFKTLYTEYLFLNNQSKLLHLELNKHGSKDIKEFENYWKIMNYYQDEILSKFENLNVHKRNKRALINGLGTVLKSITGNLDYEDGQNYDKLIEELKQNQRIINQNVLENFNTNTQIIKQFNETIGNIQHNQIILKERILNVQQFLMKQSTRIDHLFIKDIINQIIHLYNIIQNTLNNLEISISFCNLGLLHESIMPYNLLKRNLIEINKNNKFEFPDNLEYNGIKELISTHCKVENFEIDYLILVPLFFENSLELLQYTPVPTIQNNEMLTIFQSKHLLLKDNNKVYSVINNCKRVSELYYCKHMNNDIIKETKCDYQIIFNKDLTNCTYIKINKNVIKMLEISNTNKFVLCYPDSYKLNIKCQNESEEFIILKGIYLLENNKCKVNNKLLINENVNGEPIIISNYKFNITQNQKLDSEIELQNIKEMKIIRHDLKPINNAPEISKHNIIKYVLIVIIIIFIIIILFRKKFKCNLFKKQGNCNIPVATLNLPGDAHL